MIVGLAHLPGAGGGFIGGLKILPASLGGFLTVHSSIPIVPLRMARPKEFDPDMAATEAMEAFWEHGYFATSVNDLLGEMGLNRGSLYGTFKDKKTLFLAALDKYAQQVDARIAEVLDQPSARAALEALLQAAARRACGEQGKRGCLACKAAMELAPQDREIAAWVRRFHEAHVRRVAQTIQRGQQAGEISQSIDPQAAGRFVLNAIAGLHMMGTTSPDAGQVQDVVKMILKVLDQPGD
jgi:TetR/AcrR family transcriptional repressor of nem operon